MLARATMPTPLENSRGAHLELALLVFVSGAAVMAIEIVGTRVIAPIFGVNLFVWSALLAVTLAALAIGYYVGGRLVDRRPSPLLLGVVVVAAAALLAVETLSRRAVLGFSEGFGPRAGALIAAALLFAPALTALGMTGPIAVRLATTGVETTGRRVGFVYATSTAGSLLGTLAVGFWLVPAFDTDQIILVLSGLLALLGGLSLARRGQKGALGTLLLPLFASSASSEPVLPPGFKILARAQSLYGLVEVVEDSNRSVRLLRADHSIIGAAFTPSLAPAFAFLHVHEAARFMRPAVGNVLQIGLGIGSLATALKREGIRVDVVEIDPAVVRFAEAHFGFAPNGDVHVEDARTFVRRTGQRYDVIVHDTFTGGTTPEHLLSLEVVQRLRELLRPHGVLVLNLPSYRSGTLAEASILVARTLRAGFPVVRAFWDRPLEEKPAEPGNIAFFASDAALDVTIPGDARFEGPGCERILRSFTSWEILTDVPPGPVLTDLHNPLGRLELPVALAHFEAMNELLPRDVWLD
jgi:spermidine synthase